MVMDGHHLCKTTAKQASKQASVCGLKQVSQEGFTAATVQPFPMFDSRYGICMAFGSLALATS
jgi:hypothetical protein